MRSYLIRALAVSCAALMSAQADAADQPFKRVATFPVYNNLPAGVEAKTETAAEIMTYANAGNTVIYTDSPLGRLGFVDITTPSMPKAAGSVELGGEPTSVSVIGDYAYVGVNTSKSYTEPSGFMGIINVSSKEMVAKCDVKGQPDSVATSPDGSFVSIAIENERDEDLNDGVIPQMPAGHLATFNIKADGMAANCDNVTITDMTGLADVAPSDPEPEYVSINKDNIAVVTLQENNHLVLVDLKTNKIVRDFSAGTSSIAGIDNSKDKVIHLDSEARDLRREPDAVSWIDNWRFVTANEGDYEGGSRGFTVFSKYGTVLFDSGNQTEALAAMHGHFPEKRAHKKGTEPEGVAVGSYKGHGRYVFVGLERAGSILVYKDTLTKSGLNGRMDFVQFLPAGIGPEGILPIPGRNLLLVANEKDKAKKKYRSTISVYQLGAEGPMYPSIHSVVDKTTQPIGWGALSGLSANPTDPNTLYAVNDSFYSEANIYTVDVSALPARITAKRTVMKDGKPAKNLDLEGIAQDKDGTFWLVTEGHPKKERLNQILHVSAKGEIVKTVDLPAEFTTQWKRFGLEGVAVDGDMLMIAVQRPWGDDPEGMTKLISYNKKSGEFGYVHYPLEKAEKGWVGLSEIVATGNNTFLLIERDNQQGVNAAIKRLYSIDMNGVTPAKPGEKAPVVKKTMVKDMLPLMQASMGWTPDKLEGLTIAADGTAFAVTDNDGVDDSAGETQFFNLGMMK